MQTTMPTDSSGFCAISTMQSAHNHQHIAISTQASAQCHQHTSISAMPATHNHEHTAIGTQPRPVSGSCTSFKKSNCMWSTHNARTSSVRMIMLVWKQYCALDDKPSLESSLNASCFQQCNSSGRVNLCRKCQHPCACGSMWLLTL